MKNLVLIKNAASNGLLPLVRIFTAFFLTKLVLEALGSENFNLWKEIAAIFALSWILQLGLNSFLTRVLPSYYVNKNNKVLDSTISTIALIYLGIAVLFVVLGMTVVFSMESKKDIALYIIALIGYSIILTQTFVKAILSARQEFTAIAKYEIFSQLIYVFLMILVCKYLPSLKLILVVYVLQMFLPLLIMRINLRLPRLYEFELFSIEILKQALNYSYPALFFTAAISVINQLSFVFVVRNLQTELATSYILMHQLLTIPTAVIIMMIATLKPEFSKLSDKGSTDSLLNIYLWVNILVIAVSFFYFLMLYKNYDFILSVWLGETSYGMNKELFYILALVNVSYILLYLRYIYLSSFSDHFHLGLITLALLIIWLIYTMNSTNTFQILLITFLFFILSNFLSTFRGLFKTILAN